MSRISIALLGLVIAAVSSQATAGTVSTLAVLDANGGITLDSAGDIYAANYGPANSTTGSRMIWKLSPTAAFDPMVFASGINIASGNDFDSHDNLFQSNFGGDMVSKIDASGVVTTISTAVSGPVGIAIDDADNIFVANCRGNRISQITPDGTTTTFVSSSLFSCPNGITRADNGDFYVVNWTDGQIFRITPAGVMTQFAAIATPGAHVTIAGDRLYATSFGSHQIYGIPLEGADAGTIVATIGSGSAGMANGSYTVASFNKPNGITADSTGETLYVTDDTGVRKVELEDEAPAPPPPPPPPPAPAPSGDGGGGSLSWCLLAWGLAAGIRRRTRSGAA